MHIIARSTGGRRIGAWLTILVLKQGLEKKVSILLRFLLAGAALCACGAAWGQVLSPDGYGKIRFGERLAAAEQRLGQRARPRPRDPACAMVGFKRYPRVRFMVEHGRITRADGVGVIDNSAGIQAGMSVDQARERQPGLAVEPHKYELDDHYLILRKGARKALVFDTKDGRVGRVRAGLKPAVHYVEVCG
jgi:hypothetical protein